MDQQHNYPTIKQFLEIEQKTEAIKTKAKAKLRLFINSLSDKSLGDCLNELIRVKRPDLLKSDNHTINYYQLEETVYFSANTCKKILNGTTKSIKLETLLCFCAGLKLEPVLSRYLIAKAGLSITIETDINNVYNTLIDDFYEYGIDAWNYALEEADILKTTATNREAVDDTAMTLLSDWCRQNRPELIELFELVQQFRRLQKIKSTYIDGYSKFINSVTGNIHPDIFSLSTETGRMSCQHPNAQNMPRKSNDPVGIRSFIKAPEGHSIVSCDFSQIELRVGAFYCRDLKMMETYRTGGDIHAATTSVIYGISPEQAADKNAPDYKERRTIAKNVNFGTFYGLYPKGLQQTLQIKAGIVKSYDECRDIIGSIKKGYHRLTLWQRETIAEARRKGYTETWLGRRRYLPDIHSNEWGKKSFAERCALNTPIQGTAADILKLAASRILTGLPSRPWLRPILQIHDELVFIVPDDRVTEAVSFIRECMEQQPFPDFFLPLIAEAAVGPDFGHLQDINN